MNLLSICISVKNRSRVITAAGETLNLFPNCLQSLADAYPFAIDTEVIICDFHSDDWPLLDWVPDVLKNIKHKIIPCDAAFHRGLGRNLAAAYAHGNILFFLDADMLINTNLVNSGIQYALQGKVYYPTCFYYLNPENTLGFWCQGKGNVFMPRNIFDKTGKWPCPPRYNRAYFEDTVFFRNVKASGARLHIQREENYYHQYHPGWSVDVVFQKYKHLIVDVSSDPSIKSQDIPLTELQPKLLDNDHFELPHEIITVSVNGTTFRVLDHFFYRHHRDLKWEFYTYQLFRHYLKRDYAFIDIGAWIGPTILYAWEVGVKYIYAVEANPNTCRMLIENCRLNDIPADVEQLCILDREGWTHFGNASGKDPTSDLSSISSIRGDSWQVRTLSLCQYLDQYCHQDWNFIKIDIEGAETYLSNDLEMLSQRSNTVIYLSLHPPFWKDKLTSSKILLSALEKFEIKDHKLKPLNTTQLASMILTNQRRPPWGTKFGNFFEVVLETNHN